MGYVSDALDLIMKQQIKTIERDTELKRLLINLTHEVEELRKEIKKWDKKA